MDKQAKQYPVRLNDKGLDSLTAWLRSINMPTNLRALHSWEAEALQNASIHNDKLYDCGIEHGTWATKIHTLDFDLSEVIIEVDNG